MKEHLNIKLYGRVQGVGFRWATLNKARKLGIFGFVKNEIDGSLCIEAEGQQQALNEFLEWCRKGPLWAKVESMDVVESTSRNYSSFSII